MAILRFFCEWCDGRNVSLSSVEPTIVAAYIEGLKDRYADGSVKVHLVAVRMLFDYFTTGGILPFNPAQAVRGPKLVIVKVRISPVTLAFYWSDASTAFGEFAVFESSMIGAQRVRLIEYRASPWLGRFDEFRPGRFECGPRTANARVVLRIPFEVAWLTGSGTLRLCRPRHWSVRYTARCTVRFVVAAILLEIVLRHGSSTKNLAAAARREKILAERDGGRDEVS